LKSGFNRLHLTATPTRHERKSLGFASLYIVHTFISLVISAGAIMTTTVPSASQWGSPNARRRALLVHGMNSSSHTFHRVASALAAKGQSSSSEFSIFG
jgi:hypothetical protein